MSDRIRYVLDDPRGEVICLNDVIKALAKTSHQLKNLEFKNTAHALRESKRALKEAKAKFIEFELRLKNEITQEVAKDLSRIDKRIDPSNMENNTEFLG